MVLVVELLLVELFLAFAAVAQVWLLVQGDGCACVSFCERVYVASGMYVFTCRRRSFWFAGSQMSSSSSDRPHFRRTFVVVLSDAP